MQRFELTKDEKTIVILMDQDGATIVTDGQERQYSRCLASSYIESCLDAGYLQECKHEVMTPEQLEFCRQICPALRDEGWVDNEGWPLLDESWFSFPVEMDIWVGNTKVHLKTLHCNPVTGIFHTVYRLYKPGSHSVRWMGSRLFLADGGWTTERIKAAAVSEMVRYASEQ